MIICLLFGLLLNTAAQETNVGKFLGAKETVFPEWFKQSFLDFEEDIDEAANAGKRVILYFHQDGCPYCNKLVNDNFGNSAIAAKVKKNFDLVAINMWGDREVIQVGGKQFSEKTLAAALNVSFTPTLMFFNEKGKVVLRLDGYYPPSEFVTALSYVAEKKEQQTTYTDFVETLKQTKIDGEMNGEDWLIQQPYDLSVLSDTSPAAVLFEEPECENCDLLHQKTFTDPAAATLLGQFNIIQLNRWADTPVVKPDGTATTAKKWADSLGLGYVPAIVLYDAGGKQIIKITAMFRTFHILGAFDYVASGSYQTEPSFQRYLTARAERIRHTGADVDIWKY